MNVFLDTSALVPVFLADHPHHAASMNLFVRCDPQTASCASHSLAEVYATLTRIPAPHRATPDQAIKCLQDIASRFRLISHEGAGYLSVIRNAAANKIIGGSGEVAYLCQNCVSGAAQGPKGQNRSVTPLVK